MTANTGDANPMRDKKSGFVVALVIVTCATDKYVFKNFQWKAKNEFFWA